MNNNKKIENKTTILESIITPEDLRKLSVTELPKLCEEIRQFLIHTLAKTPGHFASSMGAVEIAVALHYVFNTPYDRIVWDVGHQAYPHKILTGRRSKFNTLRKKGGISGFPNPKESEYDAFVAGHASNSISAALGMALASSINNDNIRRNVVAVIGDASISGGLAFEGLNNASVNKNNLLIILNDNDMAIDNNVGALNDYMANLTTSATYNNLRFKLYKLLKKAGIVTEGGKHRIQRFNNSLKSLLSNQQNIFEGLNIRYFGPFDGHDVGKLVKVLNDIKDMEGPRILHLRTKKGKGYIPAEKSPTIWHAPGQFNPETGEIKSAASDSLQPIKYQDVAGHSIVELADSNDKIVGITAAMASGTSLCYMIDKYPERTFDVGISEGHAVTFAAGLAKEGLRPYCCIYSTFLQRAYDNIVHDVALQNLPVVFCIDRGGLVGDDGATHQGTLDLAYLRTIPNMVISAPYDEHYLRNLLFTAQWSDGPISIRYPRGKGKIADWQNVPQKLVIGRGRKLSYGNDIAILSLGTIGQNTSNAVKILKSEGIECTHYDMIFLKPIDETILEEVANNYSTVVTIEEGTVNGGLGSAVMEWINDKGYSVRVVRLGIPDRFINHATVEQQQKECGIDPDSIVETIKAIIKS